MISAAITAWCLLFAAADGKIAPTATLTGHQGPVIAVAFSPDGKRLASASDDGTLKIWNLAAKKEIATVPGVGSNRNAVHFTPDGKTLLTLAAGARLLVIDAETGKPKPPIEIADFPGGAMWFDLSPDGKLIALVGRSTLRIYDLASGRDDLRVRSSRPVRGAGRRFLTRWQDGSRRWALIARRWLSKSPRERF